MSCEKLDVSDVYKELVDLNFIEPLVTDSERSMLEAVPESESFTTQELINIANQDRTQARKEHSYPLWDPRDIGQEGPWLAGQYIELATIDVPLGHLGIQRRIDTLVLDSTTGEPISPWNDPRSWDPVFSYLLVLRSMGVRRRIPRDTTRENGILNDVVYPYRTIAGLPFFHLPQWDDQRYSWGNPANKVFMPIKDDYTIKLFAYAKEDTEEFHRVQGRLVASVQSKQTLSAAWNARRTFDV